MRKIILGLLSLLPFLGFSQENRTIKPAPGPVAKTNYANDVVILADSLDQRNVKITTAFNGWIYAAYNTVYSTSNSGGITIRMSKNGGQTWTTLDSYCPASTRYPALDIVVAGTDTNALTVYVAATNYNNGSGNYILFVDRYDGRTGTFLGSNFNRSNGTRKIYDIALATDYPYPGVGTSPYSVGLVYSTYSPTQDSVIFVGSTDGGNTWGVNETIWKTGYYGGKVSLAYGRGNSGSNGRYFAAWERRATSSDIVGNIYTARCQSTVNSLWSTPVNLDSLSNFTIGICANPEIACSIGNIDNDSNSTTAVVLFERFYAANDYDLLGFYNKTAHYTDFWNRLDVENSSLNAKQPDIVYDWTANMFRATYFDSTNLNLTYFTNDNNLTSPNTWTFVSTGYNDAPDLTAPYPQISFNPLTGQAWHAWILENGLNGRAMFDAEWATPVAIQEPSSLSADQAYPNPADRFVTIPFANQTGEDATLTVYGASGQILLQEKGGTPSHGIYTHTLNVADLAPGVYFCRIEAGGKTTTSRFVIAR